MRNLKLHEHARLSNAYFDETSVEEVMLNWRDYELYRMFSR